ncbi:type IV pilus assembly protein PilM [Arthrobacter sp. PAMC25564]|uniref:type IV pilus assembly protein PilM n=1 Tax=Arthrobacter sp. PAMC25564 TaxID=2565366 RepID=UPI0010A26F96|nr:type IV pilus assembly protein PilM [Arthrobacter sp. PAMC25564]QCB95803.1 type IV pilus assembly protein PilM [Arthrobacter sp. PAMC25564]
MVQRIGVDIGSTALRAVEVRNPDKARPTVLRYLEVPLPDGAVSRGLVAEPDVVAAALKQLWSKGGFRSKSVVLGVGNQHVLVRDLTVPGATLAAIRESLPFQVQDMLPMAVADAQLDFYPTTEDTDADGTAVAGLLVAAGKEAVLGNIEAVRRAGLRTVDVDLLPFAVSRVLLPRADGDGVVAVIDVGASTTSVLIAKDGVPQFVRLIPAGGRDLTNALATRLGMGTADAELLKRKLGLGSRKGVPEEHHEALGIIYETTSELLISLRNTIEYYLNSRPDETVRHLVLSGGGAELPGFADSLTEVTRLEVVTGDPFQRVDLSRRLQSDGQGPDRLSMTVALGLAVGDGGTDEAGTDTGKSTGAAKSTATADPGPVRKPWSLADAATADPGPARKPWSFADAAKQPLRMPSFRGKPAGHGGGIAVGGKRQIDLLPTETRKLVAARKMRDRLGLAVVAVLLLTLLSSGGAAVAALVAQGELASEQAQTGLLLAEQRQYGGVRQVQDEVALLQAARAIGMSPEIDWKAYLDDVQKTLPGGMTIDTVQIDSSSPQTAYVQSTAPLQGDRVATLSFTAKSPTLPVVPPWLDRLQALRGFADALPGSLVKSADGGYQINITMHINEAAFSKRFPAGGK